MRVTDAAEGLAVAAVSTTESYLGVAAASISATCVDTRREGVAETSDGDAGARVVTRMAGLSAGAAKTIIESTGSNASNNAIREAVMGFGCRHSPAADVS